MAGSSIDQIVEQIRHALYGKDVRESIAEGIELCYDENATVSVQKIQNTEDDYRIIFTNEQ